MKYAGFIVGVVKKYKIFMVTILTLKLMLHFLSHREWKDIVMQEKGQSLLLSLLE